MNLAEISFRAHIEPVTIPSIADTPTAKVAIQAVINALFQYSDKAINNINAPTIIQDLIPPIMYPAPITKTKVDITGIPR